DCKKKIHIDLDNFKKVLALTSSKTDQSSSQKIHSNLARPLCFFTNPPIPL
ncbi:2323_t:CDS:1, partial [Dentiscutata heterogama]